MKKHKINDKFFVEKTYANFYRHKLTNNNKSKVFSSFIFFVEKFKKLDRWKIRQIAQKKLKWFNNFTTFEFSMFMIWKIMFVKFDKISTRKKKVVIDIRDFNIIFMLDFVLKRHYHFVTKSNLYYRNECQEAKTNKFKVLILAKTREIVIVQDKSRSKKEENYKRVLIIK